LGEVRQAIAGAYQRAHQMIGEARKQQNQSEDGEQSRSEPSPILVGLSHPSAADGRKRCYEGESERHTGKQRQTTAHEWLIGARKDER
jgi:hypothetical protein